MKRRIGSKKIINDLKKKLSRVVPKTTSWTIYLSLVKVFPLKKIETKSQNEQALKVLEQLIDFTNKNEDLIKEADREQLNAYMTVLGEMISQFERNHYF